MNTPKGDNRTAGEYMDLAIQTDEENDEKKSNFQGTISRQIAIDKAPSTPNSHHEKRVQNPDSIAGKFWIVCKLAIGPIVSMFFYSFVQLVNTYYIGHTNDSTLIAGVGMGNMLINVLAFAIQQGLNGAQETLISQSFGASEKPTNTKEQRQSFRHTCGVFYNKGRFVVTMVMIPIIIIFVLSDTILIKLEQDAAVSVLARSYVTIMIPGVWAMGQFDCSRKFLSAQMVSGIPVYTQALTLVLHFGWCHLFIIKLQWNEVGAAIATNITYILNMVITDAWIRYGKETKYKDMIFFYDHTCYTDLWAYIKIGTMGMLMLCFEWWAFELLAIFSGLLGVTALASEVVVINMVTFIFMLPLGISYSASALVGNYLGEGNVKDAKIYASLTIVLNIILTSIIVILIGVYSSSLAGLFTNRDDIKEILNNIFWVLMLYIWFDTIHGVQSGIIRGLGLQVYGSIYTLVCYYIIGLPLALHFAFTKEMGIQGLWLGYSVACIILDLGFACIILCPNWQKIGNKMQQDMAGGDAASPLQSQSPMVGRNSISPLINRKQTMREVNKTNKIE